MQMENEMERNATLAVRLETIRMGATCKSKPEKEQAFSLAKKQQSNNSQYHAGHSGMQAIGTHVLPQVTCPV